MSITLFARKEPTRDTISIAHGLGQKLDTVLYRDHACKEIFRFIGISADDSIKEYLDAVAGGDKRIFFSEHEIVFPEQAEKLLLSCTLALVAKLCEEVGTVRTSDGYGFRKDEAGQWTNGDTTFESTAGMLESVDVVVSTQVEPTVNLDISKELAAETARAKG